MTPLVWLDLCSGLGGASQPALDRGWTVIRVDIDPCFRPDIVADVRALPLRPFHVDVLWISPPCQDFARFGFPWLKDKYPNAKPDLSIFESIAAILARLKPRYWIVENTHMSLRWVVPILRGYKAKVDGHFFWGRLPGLLPQIRKAHKERLGPQVPDRAAVRAIIPYEIGEAICRAVERGRENGPGSHTGAR